MSDVQPVSYQPFVVAVGVDIGETNDHVLLEGIRMANARRDAVLHVVHVAQPDTDGLSQGERLSMVNHVLEALPPRLHRHVLARAERVGGLLVNTHLHVRLGKVVETLTQFCADYEVDLLVIGTHDKSNLSRRVFGSVADSLVHTVGCPVMVVRPKNYEGIPRTERPDPLCDDCAQVRRATQGQSLWCEYHARPHVHTHVYGYTSSAGDYGSPHDPGIIPG